MPATQIIRLYSTIAVSLTPEFRSIIQSRAPFSAFLNSPVVLPNPLLFSPSSLAGGIKLGPISHTLQHIDLDWTSHAIRTDQIPILEIETVQLITGLFRVHDIFVHHERSTFGIIGYPLSYLTVDAFSH